MAILLILLYILEANGAVIPIGCFVVSWVLIFVKVFCGLIKFVAKYGKGVIRL